MDSKLDNIATKNKCGIGIRVKKDNSCYYASTNNKEFDNLVKIVNNLTKKFKVSSNTQNILLTEIVDKTKKCNLHNDLSIDDKKKILLDLDKIARDTSNFVNQTSLCFLEDYKEFIKLHRLSSFNLDDFQMQTRDTVARYVKDTVTNAPSSNNIPIVQIESKIAQINDIVELDIKERFKENFGVVVSGVDIGAIEIDKSSDGYRQLMSVTKDVASATVKAETEAKVKDIHDKQRIEAENYEEMLRVQREESQYAQHKATQSANLGAFQVEKQSEVGVAGANALGQMGANGAGGIDLGGNGGGMGFNPAAMMASMAVGGVVGQNIAGSMNNIMSGMNQPVSNNMTPPPVPTVAYNVAVNGQATGPFDLATLQQMTIAGQFAGSSLVWRPGMSAWVAAETVDELKAVLANAMPPIPPTE